MLLANAAAASRTYYRIGAAEDLAAFLAEDLFLDTEALPAPLAVFNVKPKVLGAVLLPADSAFGDVPFAVDLVCAVGAMAGAGWAE